MNQQMMMRIRKMQKELEQAQKKLQESEFTGQAGGVCTVVMNGKHEVLSVKILPDAFESLDDLDMIEDCVVMAMNDCNKQFEEAQAKILGPYASLGGGLF